MVAVVASVLLCVIATTIAIVAPLAPALGSSSGSLCHNVTEPDEVYADHGETSEGTTPEMHLSIVPYGPACTWVLSDGRHVTRDPGWGSTVIVAVAGLAIMTAVVTFVSDASPRSQETNPPRLPSTPPAR
ncbi:hypothetical protein ASG53_15400 [Sanguibacter sp. Leaf3]|nr:hypothetical protein ASG53_15400 [Sanguibacter sp. Leaf3]